MPMYNAGTVPVAPHLLSNPKWRSDYMLVQQYLLGSQGAWDTLYQQNHPAALRFLSRQPSMRYLQISDMADIISEAFLRCQANAASFQGRSSFLTWLCGFIKYIALNEASKRISEDRKVARLAYLYRTNNSASSPESILLRRERDRCLWLAYHSLPAYHKILIGYLILDQYSYWQARSVTRLHLKSEMESEVKHSLEILKRHFLSIYSC